MENKNRSRRGPIVLLVLVIVIVGFMIVGIFRENQNFDNDRVNDDYTGTLSIEDQTLMYLNATFNGVGDANGTIKTNNEVHEFSGMYQCMEDDVQFSFYAGNQHFAFIGQLEGNDTIIRGEVQYTDPEGEVFEGTFFLAIV